MHLLTRRFMFSASHRLHSAAIDAEANRCAFGLCENIHGHNYNLEVTVRGRVDPKTGFFCNVLELKAIVDRLVTDPCEHQYLNDVPLFRGLITTMENLAERIWQVLEAPLAERGMELVEVQLGEVPEHWVRYRK
jgi:6-pyruvoyltetrahydropterin/6-carboxytetrahydropterin synthase